MTTSTALAELRTFGRGAATLDHPVDVLGRARFRAAIAPGSVRVSASMDPTAPIPFGGTSILYNTRTWIGSREFGFWEQIAPQAVTKTAQEADVRLLQNHNPDLLLARTNPKMRAAGADTLRLSSGPGGMVTEADMAPTSYARDLAILLERGDCNQMSFAFDPLEWDIEVLEDGSRLVTILELRLYDVSIVTYPAYEETDAGLRAAAFDSMCREANLSPSAVLRGYLTGGHMSDVPALNAAEVADLSRAAAFYVAPTERAAEGMRPTREHRAGMVSDYIHQRALNGWTLSDAYSVLDEAVDDLCEEMAAGAWGYVYDVSDAWLVFVCYCAGDWCFMQVDYDLAEDGTVTLGAPAEVIAKTVYLSAPADADSAEDMAGDDPEMAAQMLSATAALAARTLELRTRELAHLDAAG